MNNSELENANALGKRLVARLEGAIRGRSDVIELIVIALLADGHVLLEDFPGSGKTTLARALGEAVSSSGSPFAPFRRIQFTPDLLPSDITGATVFEPDTQRLVFRQGPIFAHVVLADEINRTSPKVQAAMLEAMAEKQVTVDNQTHPLDELFFVIATQNPHDLVGTYPLPVPQLDRFLFKISMSHIAREAELEVLEAYPRGALDHARDRSGATRDQVIAARKAIRESVEIKKPLREALVDIARSIRSDNRVMQGVSTRSLMLLLPALQTRAVMHGREHVTPDDVAVLAPYVFRHRIECAPGIDERDAVIRSAVAAQVEKLVR